jgi:hypothetical protein
MKLHLDITMCVSKSDAKDTRRRFRRIKRHAAKIGYEGLVRVILPALEDDLNRSEKTIGFKP